MNNTETELNNIIAQANAVISDIKEPVGYPGGWSQQHLFSMFATISAIFKIDVDEDMVKTVINATNDIAMSKYRIALKFLWLLRPSQMALFNGTPFGEAGKSRTQAL